MKSAFFSLLFLTTFSLTKAEIKLKTFGDFKHLPTQDTTKKLNYSYPIFKLGFGQTRIPVSEIFLVDPKIEMSDFSDQLFKVKQFTITLLYATGKYESIINDNSKLTDRTIQFLKKARPGDKLLIDQIEAYSSNGDMTNIPSRSIYLK